MLDTVNDQITDLTQEIKVELTNNVEENLSPESASPETPDNDSSEESASAPPSSEQEDYLKIPRGAISNIKRKEREAGRQEALLQMQMEYEALLKQQGQENPTTTQDQKLNTHSPASPSPYNAPRWVQEGNLVENRGLQKYPGTGEFDPVTATTVGSFEHVVLNQIRQDPYAQKVAAQILQNTFPIGKEDVLYKVFSNERLLDDLRFMTEEGISRKVYEFLYSEKDKPRPVARPANKPLAEIKTPVTKPSEKTLTFREKVALYQSKR